MNLSQTVWCLVIFWYLKLLNMCVLITLLLLYSSSSDRDLWDVRPALWQAEMHPQSSQNPVSCLNLVWVHAFLLCCCRTGRGTTPPFHPLQHIKLKKKGGGGAGGLSQYAACIFIAAGCDSSTYGRLFLPVTGSSGLCRYDGLQDEIRGGDNLRINAASLPSSAAGRFSQTMTQSLGVAYFRLLLVRSCVKSGWGAVSGSESLLQNKSDHGRPSLPCYNTHDCYCISAKFFLFSS